MHIKYRSDIDGLRAIAVIFVILFHFDKNILPSGFIGVDIFFVISGFLISLIVKKSLSDDTFSFLAFYNRRLWRLQPLFIVMLFVVLIVAGVFYLPEDFLDLTNSEKYTSFFISNQYFSRFTTSYAAQESTFLPLLHTWSLAIEWQWYLVLPLALYLIHKINKKIKIEVIYFIIPLTILAFLLSVYLSNSHQDKSYYFFSTRIFEFMIGVCITYIPRKININRYFCDLLSIISIVILFLIALHDGVLIAYPNIFTLYVCLCAAVIIYTGSYNSVISKILSLKLIVLIGLLSYSLYLWHWPIFAIARYIGWFDSYTHKLLLLLLTLFLSVLSYVMIEKPFRKKKLSFKWSFLILVVFPIAAMVSINAINSKYKGLNFRLGSEFVKLDNELNKFNYKGRPECLNKQAIDPQITCHFGDIKSNKKAFFIGDSNANHFWGFMDVLGKDAGLDVYMQTTSSCLTLPNIYLYNWSNYHNAVYQRCYDHTAQYYQEIKNSKFDYVIISQVWNNYASNHVINKIGDVTTVEASRKRVEKAMREALDIIIDSGAKPVIIKSAQSMPKNFMTCFYQNVKLRKDYSNNNCNPRNYSGVDNSWFNQLFSQLSIDYPSLILIDPKDVQCSGHVCLTDIDGIPVYRDVGHITDYASTIFGNQYLNKFKNPFKPINK